MNLTQLGWNQRFDQQFESHRAQGLDPARVVREDLGRYRVHNGAERMAEVSGRFRHEARSRADYPAVGDWVAVRAGDGDGPLTIVAVLPRSSAFIRHDVGEATEAQVVAANIDTVFVMTGLDGDFNPRRLERYVTAAWESGAQPVIVLNKADVADDLEARIAESELAAPGVPVVAISAREGSGIEALSQWLTPGASVALLGMSGVGKSTLVNALLGEERLATQEVREWDSRGRHTTTHRELVPLPSGAILIDTPGMRVLQLWSGESALEGTFPEVEALARECKFGDCSHQSEPGCAVLAAEAAGTLESDRLASWRKLQRELRWLASKQDRRLQQVIHAEWRAVHNSMKFHPKLKARGQR
jgi:ribosome biogenesis GTPase / thiamine phosphate phosphatase